MEIQEIRRARLALLIKNEYGTQAKFIEATGENQSEISGLLRSKSFGERKARKLEEKCRLPRGWFDRPLEADEANLIRGAEESAALHHFPRPGLVAVAAPAEWMALVYVTQRELDLLSHYRRASEIGKSLVETAAESAAAEESGPGSAHQF
jgi:hypothetical protein